MKPDWKELVEEWIGRCDKTNSRRGGGEEAYRRNKPREEGRAQRRKK